MIEVRNATESDQDRCLALLAELQAATGSTRRHTPGDAFASLLDLSRGQILLAWEDDSILGMATVSYNIALRYGGEYCQLEELIVTPAARGKKVGGLLLNAVLDAARARGCAEIGLYLLDSTEHNQPFYEKYGFSRIGSEMRQSLTAEADSPQQR